MHRVQAHPREWVALNLARSPLVVVTAVLLLVVGVVFLSLGLGVKQGQLYERCGPLPGLGTTLGWLLAGITAFVVVVVGGIIATVKHSRAIAGASLLVAAIAPAMYATGLAVGPYGLDPCGFNEPPQSLIGRSEIGLMIETDPFRGEIDEHGECEISTQTGNVSRLGGILDQDPSSWTLAGWDVELRLTGLSEDRPAHELFIALSGEDRMPAWYSSRGQLGWTVEAITDRGGAVTFDALPLVPGADWDAPESITGSLTWTCAAGDPYE
jgi:hypothetical protein